MKTYQLVLAVLCSLIAGWVAYWDISILLSGYFWVTGIVLCVIAGFSHKRKKQTEPVANNEALRPIEKAHVKWDYRDWLIVIVLTILALGLRLYQLNDFFPVMHGDEGEMGHLARQALYGYIRPGSPMLPFLSLGAWYKFPTLFYHLQAGSMLLFGDSLTGLRTLSAIAGALCVPIVYAIGHCSWGRFAGFITGWLLAVSHLHIHFSRLALNNIETVLAMIVVMWLVIRIGLSRQKLTSFTPYYTAIGLLTGLSQYLYSGSRLILVLTAILLPVLWIKNRCSILHIGITLAACFIAFFPQAAQYFDNFSELSSRFSTVNVFSETGVRHTLGPDAALPRDTYRLILHQLERNASYFVLKRGDHSSFYPVDITAFDVLTGGLFWIGLIIAFVRIRRFPEFALLLWFGTGFVFAGVVTTNAPYAPRLIMIMPVVYCLAGLAAHSVLRGLIRLLPATRYSGTFVALLIMLPTLYLNVRTYFLDYPRYRPNTNAISIAKEIAGASPPYHVYLFAEPQFYTSHGTIRFTAPGAKVFDVSSTQQFFELFSQQTRDKGAIIIALEHHKTDLEYITISLPRGEFSTHVNPQGEIMYYSYLISSVRQQNNQ